MARGTEVPLQPVPGDPNGGYTRHMPDYAPRDEDHAWIARNLGDVPARPRSDWRNNTWSREL